MLLSVLPNLLIVDDNIENLIILKSVTRNIEVNVIEASSGMEALEKIKGIELALAIIDVQMPEMNGHDLAIKINENRDGAKVPIIFLTARYYDEADVFKGYNNGAVDFIFKPVSIHILISKIKIFLDLFIQKQTVIQNVAERMLVEEKLMRLTEELEDRVKKRTAELVQSNIAIQQIQKNHEIFFNSVDDFLFVLDVQGNVINTNKTVNSRLGYSSKELLGKSVLMVHPPECRDEVNEIICKILKGQENTFYVPLSTKSGIQIPVETKVTHGFWDGQPVIFIVTKDISNIKLSEEKFSKLFFLNPAACGLSNLDDNKYIEVNDVFLSLLGFDREEVVGKSAIDLGIMTSKAKTNILKNADSNGRLINAEVNLKAKNGDIKHVLLSAEIINVHNKSFRFTVAHDITERRRMEKSLVDKEVMLSKAQQIAHIGSWELHNETHDLHWSEETFRIFGYEPNTVNPNMELFLKSVHPEDKLQLQESITNAWNSLIPFNEVHRIILPDGQERIVQEQAEIVYNQCGKPEKWMGTVQDITEKTHIQKNIIKAIIETEVKERAYFSKELHDGLGPLLSTIKLYLQWSERPKSSKSREEIILKAEEILEGALTTVKEISNKLSPHLLKNYGLTSAIQNFVDQIGESSPVRISFQSNTVRRVGLEIESTVYRAVTECINNTLKHGRARKISIILNDSGSMLSIRYSDDGTGFDIRKTLSEKKGLGLYNLQNRIETVGGIIKMNSDPGHGVDYQISINI